MRFEPRAGARLRQALAREGVSVVINGRDAPRLGATAEAIRAETGSPVEPVVANLDDPADRERLIAARPEADILVDNNAGPAPGRFEDWDHAAWLAARESNLPAPAMVIRGLLPGMKDRGFGHIVNIASAMVKTPLAPMALSTAARSGLTARCKASSREAVAHNVTINDLLPERIDTDRQVQMAEVVAKLRGISYEEARAEQVASISAARLGTPAEFGDACAYLCSARAGYLSGQNVQLDGGSYEGLI